MGVVHQAVQNGICESVTGKCAVHFGLHLATIGRIVRGNMLQGEN